MIPNILTETGLPSKALTLYYVILRSANEQEKQVCFRGERRLAEDSGMSTWAVRKYKRLLKNLGYITIKEVESGRGHPSHHISIVPLQRISQAFFALKGDDRPVRKDGTVWGLGQPGQLVEYRMVGETTFENVSIILQLT